MMAENGGPLAYVGHLILVKIPTVGPQNLIKSDQISLGVPSIFIENE